MTSGNCSLQMLRGGLWVMPLSALWRHGNLLYNPPLIMLGVLSNGLTDSFLNCCSYKSWEFKSLHFPQLSKVGACILMFNTTKRCAPNKRMGHMNLFALFHNIVDIFCGLPVQWKLTSFSQRKLGTILSRSLRSTCLMQPRYCYPPLPPSLSPSLCPSPYPPSPPCSSIHSLEFLFRFSDLYYLFLYTFQRIYGAAPFLIMN